MRTFFSFLISIFDGYRGRRHFGFSRIYPAASDRPQKRVRTRINLGGQEITR